MNKWELLDTTRIPNEGGTLRLLQRGEEFAIRIAGVQGDLMNSRTHGSEDALGQLACEPLKDQQSAQVLIGGLGMGFTLAASLDSLGEGAQVTVAELVPGVTRWNREIIGGCAGHPLQDPRVVVKEGDVADIIRRAEAAFDAILLDVDNGPEGLTHQHNDCLYNLDGLETAYNALRETGVLAVWSASPVPKFNALLQKTGFDVDERRVRAHAGKGARHVIWLASRR